MTAVGSVSTHIKLLSSGDSYLLKHYCTTTENSYGATWAHFTPRLWCHSGAGFVPNNRGKIFYTSHLDEIDNPRMGEIIKKNYKTITHKDYVGLKIPNGGEKLPYSALYKPTGFVRDAGVHIPTEIQLQSQFINGLLDKSPSNVISKHRPYLHETYPKDPIMLENSGYGPLYMSTEYKTKFDGKQSKDLGPGAVGKCEMSGFTENNKTEETLEGRPDACNCNHDIFGPPPVNCRPTGTTMYKLHYRPLKIPSGIESLPNIETRAAVSNGFFKGNKAIPDFVEIHPERVYDKASDMTEARLEWIRKNDPAEYINSIHCNKAPTMMNIAYQGKQINSIDKKNVKFSFGFNEPTGYTSNEDVHIQSRDDPSRFMTHNMTKYYDVSLIGSERNGHVNMHVLPVKEDGFSRGVKLNKIEAQFDAFNNSSRFTPYQSRSIIARESVSFSPTKVAI